MTNVLASFADDFDGSSRIGGRISTTANADAAKDKAQEAERKFDKARKEFEEEKFNADVKYGQVQTLMERLDETIESLNADVANQKKQLAQVAKGERNYVDAISDEFLKVLQGQAETSKAEVKIYADKYAGFPHGCTVGS